MYDKVNGYFDVRNNGLQLLIKVPDDVVFIDCCHNHLKVLPELPEGLLVLRANYNNLEVLPKLPNTILQLECTDNRLKYLPKLPDRLRILYCDDNPIECIIPEKFHTSSRWYKNYYFPFINSYIGQYKILKKFPEQCGELMKQAKILPSIRNNFSYLINSCELNLL